MGPHSAVIWHGHTRTPNEGIHAKGPWLLSNAREVVPTGRIPTPLVGATEPWALSNPFLNVSRDSSCG